MQFYCTGNLIFISCNSLICKYKKNPCMATTKNPLIRYKILDKCFRNPYKKYYFETLLQTVNDNLFEITGDLEGIKTRQLRDDIAFMRSSEGWGIDIEELYDGKKKIYRYEDLNFSIILYPSTIGIFNIVSSMRYRRLHEGSSLLFLSSIRLDIFFSLFSLFSHIIQFYKA